MYHVKLSPEEMEILNQVLQNSLATVELEIRHTDHQEFKNLLKHRRGILQALAVKTQQRMEAAA